MMVLSPFTEKRGHHWTLTGFAVDVWGEEKAREENIQFLHAPFTQLAAMEIFQSRSSSNQRSLGHLSCTRPSLQIG